MQSPADIPSAKYFQSLIDLPLWRYIECAVDKNYKALIIEGEVEMEELIRVWYSLQSEYADVAEDEGLKRYMTVFKKCCYLETTINQANLMLVVIEGAWIHLTAIGDDDPVYEELYKQKEITAEKFSNLFSNPFLFLEDTWEYDLMMGQAYITSLELRLEAEMSKLDKISKESEEKNGKIAGREYYYDTLITLTDHSKVPLTHDISTYEFARRVSNYQEYVKQLNIKKSWQTKN